MTPQMTSLLQSIRRLHEQIREAVVAVCERTEAEDLARVVADDPGDTIYAVDKVSEECLVGHFEREAGAWGGMVLVAEGLPGGQRVIGARDEASAALRIIADPIDGTRGLIYQKRSAWVLTGVAPNRGPQTALADIELAVQTEIPLVKQHLCDCAWACRGEEAWAERFDRLTGQRAPLALQPSRAESIAQGYAMVSRFFPGARDELAAIDEEVVRELLGPAPAGKALCFEDQYASTGGQLFELLSGRDRFNADLRPLMAPILAQRGLPLGLCCHPYDLCTELIARQAGVIITDPAGGPVRCPLAVEPDVAWVGYANPAIRTRVEPALHRALRRRGLL